MNALLGILCSPNLTAILYSHCCHHQCEPIIYIDQVFIMFTLNKRKLRKSIVVALTEKRFRRSSDGKFSQYFMKISDPFPNNPLLLGLSLFSANSTYFLTAYFRTSPHARAYIHKKSWIRTLLTNRLTFRRTN